MSKRRPVLRATAAACGAVASAILLLEWSLAALNPGWAVRVTFNDFGEARFEGALLAIMVLLGLWLVVDSLRHPRA